MTKLNTADGSPMTALGMMILQLRIADFKFTHNFIIYDRLPDTEILFGIDVQKKFPCHMPEIRKRTVTYRRMGDFSPTLQTVNRRQLWDCQVNCQIPPRHNGIVPIKIKGHTITEHMAYFISNQDSTKGKDPKINIINSIHNIKGKTSVNILMSNYTNKHITFNKGEYIGHLEPPTDEILQSSANPDLPTTHSITMERMMAEKVKLDTFKPLHHKLKHNIKTKLTELLKEYNSQSAQDETTIGTTPLTEMTTDRETSKPLSQKPYPIAMKHCKWVKDRINKLLMVKVIQESQ